MFPFSHVTAAESHVSAFIFDSHSMGNLFFSSPRSNKLKFDPLQAAVLALLGSSKKDACSCLEVPLLLGSIGSGMQLSLDASQDLVLLLSFGSTLCHQGMKLGQCELLTMF